MPRLPTIARMLVDGRHALARMIRVLLGSPPCARLNPSVPLPFPFSQVETFGDVTIEDVDLQRGTYVVLLNVSANKKAVTLSGWSLSVSDGETETAYKFPRGCVSVRVRYIRGRVTLRGALTAFSSRDLLSTKIASGETKRLLSAKGKDNQRDGDLLWSKFVRIV